MSPSSHSNWAFAAVLIVLILSIAGCGVTDRWATVQSDRAKSTCAKDPA